MHEFELRPIGGFIELSGGELEKPLKYPLDDPDAAIRNVGFMSERYGSVLRIFNEAGDMIESQRREAVMPLKGAVGGLEGPDC